MESKVSVVVPVYNVEKYLDRCLNSIVNQTYHNLEIILVDDGSPDRCPEMCEEWAKKDNRIKMIHKENAGLGMARNTGIENATGDYILFVDSDDFIELNTVEQAYKLAIKEKADIVYYGYKDVDASGKVINENKPEIEKCIYRQEEVCEEILPELLMSDYSKPKKSNLMLSACTALFSLEMIRRVDWRFVSERKIISEDVYSLMELFINVKSVAVLSESLYCYCQNETSLTRIYRRDRYEGIKYFYDESIKLCEAYRYSTQVKERLSNVYLSYVIAALKLIMLSEMNYYNKLSAIKEILEDSHLKRTLIIVNFRIESRRRKKMCSILLNGNILACYFLLFMRCKLMR